MGKIISNFFISLDGVVESPDQWHFGYFNDEMGEIIGAGMSSSAGFIMGRKLYDEWSSYWPNANPDDSFTQFFNDVRKFVISDSLEEAEWNNTTIIRGDEAVSRVQQLRDEGDWNLSGSATTVRWLLAHDLLDELRLLLHPVVVGKGQRLFEDGAHHPLKLVDSKALSTGVLSLTYAPDPDPPANEPPAGA